MKTLIWDGHTFNVVATCSEDIARFVLGNWKYKPVGQKVHLVALYNPDSRPLVFTPLSIGELPVLPFQPIELENLQYTERITKDCLTSMLKKIPVGFLSKVETELFTHLILTYEKAFAFEENECGTFNEVYFPPYEMPMVPHEPWMKKNIRIPLGRMDEVLQLLQEQWDSRKYECSASSYRSAIFAVEKKSRFLRLVHNLQPLNGVTIRDASLPPRIDEMIEQFTG
jgi:hypothetical protein